VPSQHWRVRPLLIIDAHEGGKMLWRITVIYIAKAESKVWEESGKVSGTTYLVSSWETDMQDCRYQTVLLSMARVWGAGDQALGTKLGWHVSQIHQAFSLTWTHIYSLGILYRHIRQGYLPQGRCTGRLRLFRTRHTARCVPSNTYVNTTDFSLLMWVSTATPDLLTSLALEVAGPAQTMAP
jgi:hypothetical protein